MQIAHIGYVGKTANTEAQGYFTTVDKSTAQWSKVEINLYCPVVKSENEHGYIYTIDNHPEISKEPLPNIG